MAPSILLLKPFLEQTGFEAEPSGFPYRHKNGAAGETTAPRKSPCEDVPNAPRASARAGDLNPPADRLLGRTTVGNPGNPSFHSTTERKANDGED
jgi:hypothetical protein